MFDRLILAQIAARKWWLEHPRVRKPLSTAVKLSVVFAAFTAALTCAVLAADAIKTSFAPPAPPVLYATAADVAALNGELAAIRAQCKPKAGPVVTTKAKQKPKRQ